MFAKEREASELTPLIPWRKSRYQEGLGETLAGRIKLRSLLRAPDSFKNAASAIKYKDKEVDWINEHYRTRLSVHKGEYKLEADLAQTIVGDFCEAGWKVVMYEYKLHRWDGDLVFVKNEVCGRKTSNRNWNANANDRLRDNRLFSWLRRKC